MNNIVGCFMKSIWRSIYTLFVAGYPSSGHTYDEKTDIVHKNCTVTESKCENCGKISISWEK